MIGEGTRQYRCINFKFKFQTSSLGLRVDSKKHAAEFQQHSANKQFPWFIVEINSNICIEFNIILSPFPPPTYKTKQYQNFWLQLVFHIYLIYQKPADQAPFLPCSILWINDEILQGYYMVIQVQQIIIMFNIAGNKILSDTNELSNSSLDTYYVPYLSFDAYYAFLDHLFEIC